ncbi:MAG: hypothetical protein AAFR92_08695 [Pseudomonadota bacterium]
MGELSSIPYRERTDAQKAQTQWRKAIGLLRRSDWSAAIVRAVTAAEISLNLALRAEYKKAGKLVAEEVDQLLMKANGLFGKLDLLKSVSGSDLRSQLKDLKSVIKEAAIKRNRIVHSGEFCSEVEARRHTDACEVFVNRLIANYESCFKLADVEIAPQEDPGA